MLLESNNGANAIFGLKDLRGTDLAVGKTAFHYYPVTIIIQDVCFNIIVGRLSIMLKTCCHQ